MKNIVKLSLANINPAKSHSNIADNNMCYLGNSSPSDLFINISNWVFFIILCPISSLIISIVHVRKLLARKNFNIINAIYQGFNKYLILSVIFSVLFMLTCSISIMLGEYSNYYNLKEVFINAKSFWWSFLVILAEVNIVAGFVYLISAIKNRKIIKIGLAFIFVLPALYIYIKMIICKAVPSLRCYVPKDDIETKKDQLRKKLKI